MNTGLYRTDWTRLAKLPGLAKLPSLGIGRGCSQQPANTTVKYLKPRFAWLAAAVPIAGLGAWLLLSGHASHPAAGDPVELATAVATEPAPSPAAEPAGEMP
jgi:hypothetical protein